MPSGVYKRKPFSKKHKDNISKSLKDRKLSKEHRQNTSKGLIKYLAKLTKEELLKRTCSAIEANIGAKRSKQARQNISEGQQKLWDERSEKERSEHMLPTIESNQRLWKSMTKKEKREHPWIKSGIKASQKANPSSIEKIIWKELDKLGIEYETQVRFGRFIVDIYIPSKGLILECNGTYYHNYKIFPGKKIRDEGLEKYANKIGLKVAWLWESDIRRDPKSVLLKVLKRQGVVL